MKKKAIIIGAGITGMRIAVQLAESGYEVNVLEKTPKIGGMTSSFRYNDFILDYGPHKFYSQSEEVYDDFKAIIGEGNYLKVKKKNSLRLLGKYFDFPVKLSQLLLQIKPAIALKIIIDLIKAQVSKKKPETYEQYFTNGFGKTGYEILFKGFAEKVWGNPKNLSEELARRRSPAKNVFDVLKTAILNSDKNTSAEFFLYPKMGYGVMCEMLAQRLKDKKGKILLGSKVEKIIRKKDKIDEVTFRDSANKIKKLKCDVLVSTSSIQDLCSFLEPKIPLEISESLKKLKFRSLLICYVFLNKTRALKDNWIFFPEKEFCFNRVAEQKSFSKYTCPAEKTVITAEITCDYGDEIYSSSEDKIKERVIKDLIRANLIKGDEVYDFIIRKAGKVYPVYSVDYKKHLNNVLEWLDKTTNLYSVGRLGLFNYNNADHCLDMAKVTSKIIIENKSRNAWKLARDYFDSYRIVD